MNMSCMTIFEGLKFFRVLVYCEQNGGRNNVFTISGDAVWHALTDAIFNFATLSQCFPF